MKAVSVILILITLFSCEHKKVNKQNNFQIKQNWRFFKIEVDNKLIWVPNDQDTCFYREKIYDDKPESNKRKYSTIEKRFVLSKQQRDSVFSLGEDAIKNFKKTDQFVSCYAGQYVSIILDNSNNSISCRYSSISDWTKISKTLLKISKMTFEKIK